VSGAFFAERPGRCLNDLTGALRETGNGRVAPREALRLRLCTFQLWLSASPSVFARLGVNSGAMRTCLVGLCFLSATCLAADLPRFKEVTVASGLKMGYQLVVTDVNGDGKKDLIALDERSTEVSWLENPAWESRLLVADVPRPINLDASDIDNDGVPEIALAHNFETNPEKSVGNVLLLKSGPNVRAPWTRREIDRVPTAHRLRWIKTNGQRALVVAPLVGAAARAPDYADSVPIYLYAPPDWKRTLLTSEPYGILHSIYPVIFRGSTEQLLTASFSGIRLYSPEHAGNWKGEEIAKGNPEPCPRCGTSEVKLGRLAGTRFIGAIEPWHGNQVVVYAEHGTNWNRTVLEQGMVNGHALAVGDLNADGNDEIVAGFRGRGYQLYVFTAEDTSGLRWRREILDAGTIAAADCKIEDLNGDGRPDIACVGASTGNVKIYENQGR